MQRGSAESSHVRDAAAAPPGKPPNAVVEVDTTYVRANATESDGQRALDAGWAAQADAYVPPPSPSSSPPSSSRSHPPILLARLSLGSEGVAKHMLALPSLFQLLPVAPPPPPSISLSLSPVFLDVASPQLRRITCGQREHQDQP
jgi:hypothetical protein